MSPLLSRVSFLFFPLPRTPSNVACPSAYRFPPRRTPLGTLRTDEHRRSCFACFLCATTNLAPSATITPWLSRPNEYIPPQRRCGPMHPPLQACLSSSNSSTASHRTVHRKPSPNQPARRSALAMPVRPSFGRRRIARQATSPAILHKPAIAIPSLPAGALASLAPSP